MSLHYLMYASRLTVPMGFEALNSLLQVSQHNNEHAQITGFLHIENEIALQYLEGPADQLHQTVDRIRKDDRHTEFSILAEGTLQRRHFDNWKMALVENTTLSLFDLMGTQTRAIRDVAKAHPLDLISFLSANASFLRHQPSVA